MHLESPWISGVRYKGLESIWNWFWLLNLLDFFIERNRKHRRSKVLKYMTVEHQSTCSGIQRIKFSKFLQNVWKRPFFSHCSFITFAHVHWATNAQWMSCLHGFSSSLALSGFSACERVYTQNIAFNKHFAWLEVNSYKLK